MPIRNPSYDASENPLTLTLSPQGWGEGTGDDLVEIAFTCILLKRHGSFSFS